ncbi:hypothetical protein JCM10295v2_006792 [Rhodotorula toruloides]
MPSPPPSTTRSSAHKSSHKLKRGDFAVAPIPPFRGARGERRHSTASGPPPPLPPNTPASAVPRSLTKNDRRVSYPSVFAAPSVFSVFSLPAPGPPNRTPVPNGITTGLGIEGVGVGVAGSKEALVVERLGEAPSSGNGGRRGSLKRVLVSDEEDQLAPVVQANGSAHSSGMNGRVPSIPLPLQRPPSLPRHDSATSLDRRRADSSSPKHSLGPNGEGAGGGGRGGGSPTLSNKRPRTRLSPLDSLADTATSILSASAPASSQHNPHNQSTQAPASSSRVPISSLLSGPVSSSATSALEASKAIKEQQQREIDRRREAAGLAAGPAPGSVQAALGKLRAQQQASTAPASTATGGGGLAKRRGHRPPAVATGSSAASASHRRNASTSHAVGPAHDFALHHAPLRSAPAVEIPSVLVGSPLEATFAARAVAAREAPAMRPSASSSGATASSTSKKDSRRQSGGAPTQQQAQPQPPLVSSSSYYIRPNQPLGPGVAFPPAPAPSTSPFGRKDDPKQTGPRLPPISRMTSASRVAQPQPQRQQQQQQPPPPPPPGFSHSSQSALAHLPAYYPPPQHLPHYPPHSPLTSAPLGPAPLTPLYPSHPASTPAPTGSASKQAFLGLFSTFYDSLSDSRVLTHSLDHQVQRANAVLSTLQQAEGQLEALVETRVGEVRREWDEKWRGVEERLERLERSAALGPSDGSAGLEERLVRLERLGDLVAAEQQDQPVGQASRCTSASTDSSIEGGTEGSVMSASVVGGAGSGPGEREDEEMRQA